MNEYGSITRIALKHARDAFASQTLCDLQWRDLNFTAVPDYAGAIREYDAFAAAVSACGADVVWLPLDERVSLDSVYVRDAALVCDRGVILCEMGKPQRRAEPTVQGELYRALGLPVLGAIEAPGKIEGGDVVWFDARTVAVGRGYRTNDEGIRQFAALLGDDVRVISVPLPHYRGQGDVFHLMSIISPVDRDLAVVYSPLMPVPFREWLIDQGITLVEVPDSEFDSMGANVLAVAPRQCVMVAGNPITRARLESAGAAVVEYDGHQISLKGGGGPTCLTRPLARRA